MIGTDGPYTSASSKPIFSSHLLANATAKLTTSTNFTDFSHFQFEKPKQFQSQHDKMEEDLIYQPSKTFQLRLYPMQRRWYLSLHVIGVLSSSRRSKQNSCKNETEISNHQSQASKISTKGTRLRMISYEFIRGDGSCMELTAAERPKKRDGGHGREKGEKGNEGNLGKAMNLS